MSALDTIYTIISNPNLYECNLKCCLVDEKKIPYKKDNTRAKPNEVNDFVNINELVDCKEIDKYKGIGISIQANNICAIDVDHCIASPFNIDTCSSLAYDLINMFKNDAYIEYSFSGSGLRILFKNNKKTLIDSKLFYIKNSKVGIEFYNPLSSYRYVTITGRFIYNNKIKEIDENILNEFLNKYMKREKREIKESQIINSNKDTLLKYYLLKNEKFQNNWFNKAPGSGKDESERDFYLISFIYQNITKNRNEIKEIFEKSNFYKTKDFHHKLKWERNENAYLDYLLERIEI